MRPEEIREHLRRRPFQPIRLFVSDGSFYDVRHPEMAIVSRLDVIVSVGQTGDEIPERSAYLDPVHITRVEPINGPTS